MTPLDACRDALAEATAAVTAIIPAERTRALLALVHAGDAGSLDGVDQNAARPGWSLALRLVLERPDDGRDHPMHDDTLALWAGQFLDDCDRLALAGQALAQCASGSLQLEQRGPGTFVAWGTSRRIAPEQRERADFDWWSARLAEQVAARLASLRAERARIRALDAPATARYYRQIGESHVARFANQHSYPPDATIGGVTLAQYHALLALLIGWLYRDYDRAEADSQYTPVPQDEAALIATLAAAMDTDPATVAHAIECVILDRDNAAYHSTLPGAAPPLIRLDAGRVVLSARGLLAEPLIFLARQLRRRYAQEYHDSARLREAVFRQDLARLFRDRRYSLSAGRVELKRSGEARTDLDALVFDRKTGALGVFELKTQDPFTRTVEERQRQRDNFFHANRQVSAILEWVQRRGPDDLLVRFDERAAKRFRVQKVHVFVLGRYLAHFTGGPEPERRAAWGSWPQVMRIAADGGLGPDARNPLGTLFTRLRDAPPPVESATADVQTIAVGDFRLRVYPTFAAMRAAEE